MNFGANAEGETTVRAYLREKFRQSRPGGRLIIRDVVGPDDADRDVLLGRNLSDGKELAWNAALETQDRSQAFLESLSILGRFLHIFLADFLRNRPRREVLVPSHPASADAPDTYRVSFRLAAEFLSKKDYTDNWSSEMNEEFCFWSFTQWKDALRDTGFEIIEQEVSGNPLPFVLQLVDH